MAGAESNSQQTSYNTIRDECARYATLSGFKETDLPRGLESLAAHVFAMEEGFRELCEGDDPETADLEDYICRRNDLGIDIVLPDEEGKRLLLVQCAHKNKGLPPEDKVKAFFDCLDHLVNPSYLETGSEQIQHLLGALAEQIADGYEITLRFVTDAATGDADRLKALVAAANEKYSSRSVAVTCELFGRTELIRHWDELKSGSLASTVGEVAFKVQEGRYFLLDEPKAPYRTLIAQVKANELVALYKIQGVGASLFNLNIRLPLASKKINPQMQQTASDASEAPNFFYYNNGISAVCSSFELLGNSVHTKRLQIVNGAQTLSALVKANKKLSTETYVLLRLTATEESYGGPFTDNIIRYNNTQNPVKVADFYSNDPLQAWIKRILDERSGKGPMPTIEYIHKSGMRTRKGHKALSIESLAGMRHSYLYGPVTSYKEPKSFFDKGSDSKYGEAFGIDGIQVDQWDDEAVAQCCAVVAINSRIRTIAAELKKSARTKEAEARAAGKQPRPNLEAKYLDRLARYVAALVGVGLDALIPDELSGYATLMSSEREFKKYVDPLVDWVRERLHVTIAQRYESSQQPEYNFARSSTDWTLLEDAIVEAIENGRIRF